MAKQDNAALTGSTEPVGLFVLAILAGCAVMIGLAVLIDRRRGDG